MRLFVVLTLSFVLIILALIIAIFFQYRIIEEPQITELYFTEPDNLPRTIPSNNIVEFSFSINNKGLQEESLIYLVIIKSKEEKILTSNSVLLEPNEIKTIKQRIKLDEIMESAFISVELFNKNQEIHFWVKRDGS